ncbi:hypothetical protein [Roseixanthobacter pseudopolyaromaticivorans]|uniref:hypothetical protein n=1 Tax=Xanthobacteraceae TaxID=335928 RepID=UPI003728C3DC
MTKPTDPTTKILRKLLPGAERFGADWFALEAGLRYARHPEQRAGMDEVLRHAGLDVIARAVLVDGVEMEAAGRAASGYATRPQAVAYAAGQLTAALRLMAWAEGSRARERQAMAGAISRIQALESTVEQQRAALRARVAVPA